MLYFSLCLFKEIHMASKGLKQRCPYFRVSYRFHCMYSSTDAVLSLSLGG